MGINEFVDTRMDAVPLEYKNIHYILRYMSAQNALNYFNAEDVKAQRMALAEEYAESVGEKLHGYPPNL